MLKLQRYFVVLLIKYLIKADNEERRVLMKRIVAFMLVCLMVVPSFLTSPVIAAEVKSLSEKMTFDNMDPFNG